MLNVSSCVFFWHLDFFEKALFSSFACFFIELLTLREFSFLSSLYILVINLFVRCVAGKDFLPFCGLPLQSGDHFSYCVEAV
jgi:hypothetical protein